MPSDRGQQLIQHALRVGDYKRCKDILYSTKKHRPAHTSEWLSDDDEFLEWKTSRNSRLWICGRRCGKTILSGAIIDNLRAANADTSRVVGLAYHFFSTHDTTLPSFQAFLLSALGQLCQSHRSIIPEKFIRDDIVRHPASELSRVLMELISKFDYVYIVVDGLDECNVRDRNRFLGLVKSMGYGHNADCRVMILSRLNVNLARGTRDLQFRERFIKQDLVTDDRTASIAAEVRAQDKLLEIPEELQNAIINIMRNEPTHDLTKLLLKILTELSEVIDDFVNIFKAFNRVLAKLPDREEHLSHRFLGVVASAFRPLSLDDYADILLMEPWLTESLSVKTKEGILKVLERMLNQMFTPMEDHSNKLTLLHLIMNLSAEKYLGHSRLRDSHSLLAIYCLRYITEYARSPMRKRNSADLEDFPLLQYACKSWHLHAQLSAQHSQLSAQYSQLSAQHSRPRTRSPRLTTSMKREVVLLLSNEDLIECWLSVFDPDDESKLMFTNSRSQAPPLHYAVMIDSLETVECLLDQGADISAKDSQGRQALNLALRDNSIHIVRALLSRGAIPSVDNLLDAARSNQVELTHVISQHIGLKQICEIRDKTTTLHELAKCATGKTFTQLIRSSDDFDEPTSVLVNLKDGDGWSLLHRAVEEGNIPVCRVLIQHGADVNLPGLHGDTPLHICCNVNDDRENIKQLLIQNGADRTHLNDREETPMQLAWAKKAFDWTCYEVDIDEKKSKRITPGKQADCRILRKARECGGPEFIFRKTYDLKKEIEDANEIYEVLLRECDKLQSIEHPFVISYLGYEELLGEDLRRDSDPRKLPDQVSLYLEYCDGGDLGPYVEKKTPKHSTRQKGYHSNIDDIDEDPSGRKFPTPPRKANGIAEPLNESEVWTLMYQLFLALAYLHYGVQVTKDGKCQCLPHWKGLIHRDIKPNNVVLASAEHNSRTAKLCDLGIARDISRNQTIATSRGTPDFQPPELNTPVNKDSPDSECGDWTTKGDVWSLGKTIHVLKKNFTPHGKMKDILDRCRSWDPESRPSSLEVVEEVHKCEEGRKHVKGRYSSLDEVLGRGPGGFLYQAFLKIATGLDESINLKVETETAMRPRKLLLKRLRLLLRDGAKAPFLEHSISLHHAVLLNEGDMLNRLLQDGFNPDDNWDTSHWTPLHLAVQQKKQEMVRDLLRAGARPDRKDKHGFTPRDYADIPKGNGWKEKFESIVNEGKESCEKGERWINATSL